MKLNYTYIKNVCTVGAMLLFLVVMHTMAVYIFAVRHVVAFTDPLLSAQGKATIDEQLKLAALTHSFSIQHMATHMHNTFGYIKSIRLKRTPDQIVHADICFCKPWIHLVHQDHILMENRCSIPKTYVDCAHTQAIAHLATNLIDPVTRMVDNQLIDALASLAPDFMTNSYITCNNLHEIRIKLPHEQLELVCNQDMMPQHNILVECRKIRDELSSDNRYLEGISADIRFCNQIIVSTLQARG